MSADDLSRLIADAGEPADDRRLADLGRDDIGNAERLIARHGADLRKTVNYGAHVYDTQRWRPDPDEAQALLRAQRTARAIVAEARALEKDNPGADEDAQKEHEKRVEAHFKWATSSANSQRLNGMLGQAWPHLALPFERWNAKSDLLNVLNGTLDLSSIEPVLRPHAREDYITHIAGVSYDADATCPAFRAYIDLVMPPEGADGADRSKQLYLQRVLGSCLIDSARDRCIVMFHGGGSNGKSTVLNAVAAAIGSYAMTINVETLLYSEKSGAAASPDVARLAERPRLVRASEPEQGARLAEGSIKGITGGEPLAARKLHQDIIEFLPNFKIILSINSRPSIRGADDGIWDRIQLLKWDVRFSDEDKRTKGPAIVQALHAELPGILNWLIEGLADYRERGGLDPPESVLDATRGYRGESDPVGRFLAECCQSGEGRETEGAELYEAFKLWSLAEGNDRVMSANMFGRKLSDRGHNTRKSHGLVYRIGLELEHEWRLRVREVADKAARKRGGLGEADAE